MMLNYLFKNKPALFMFLILCPINAAIEVGLAYIMSSAISYALEGTITDLWKYVIAFFSYILFSLFIGYIYAKSKIWLLSTTMSSLKVDLHNRLMNLSTENFLKKNSSEYLARLTANADMVRDSWYAIFLELYPNILKFIIATIAMFHCNTILGLYVILFAIIQAAIPSIFSTRIAEKGKISAFEQENYISILKENFASFTTSKIFNILRFLNHRHEIQARKTASAWAQSKTLNRLSFEISFAIGNIIFLGIYLIGAVLVLTEHITLASVIAASQLMVYIASPLTTISGDIAEVKSTSKVVASFKEILLINEQKDRQISRHNFEQELVFDRVCFSYDDRPILDNICYRFKKGKKYIILGESGSGKSTLLKLVSQVYNTTHGNIFMDGINISDILINDYYNIVGTVPQEPFLFNTTIAENLRLFKDISEDDILSVLNKVGLETYINHLSEGINSYVGENALQMSGGEKQRLSIARVLLNHCPILLLDECTSQLDSDTASEIEQLVFSLSEVTVLFVTHHIRKETLAAADEILEMKNGKLKKIQNLEG